MRLTKWLIGLLIFSVFILTGCSAEFLIHPPDIKIETLKGEKIPYKINESIARSSKQVVEQNFGDCDDKSNLLISMLKVKGYEAYFVLVPKHIFVIVNLEQKLQNSKALYVNDKPFYILESTAEKSKIGFPLKYSFEEIDAIIDPFVNKKLLINSLEYK